MFWVYNNFGDLTTVTTSDNKILTYATLSLGFTVADLYDLFSYLHKNFIINHLVPMSTGAAIDDQVRKCLFEESNSAAAVAIPFLKHSRGIGTKLLRNFSDKQTPLKKKNSNLVAMGRGKQQQQLVRERNGPSSSLPRPIFKICPFAIYLAGPSLEPTHFLQKVVLGPDMTSSADRTPVPPSTQGRRTY